MNTLITLLIVVAVVAVAIWLIRQIPFPAGLAIVGQIMICIVVIMGLIKVLGLL